MTEMDHDVIEVLVVRILEQNQRIKNVDVLNPLKKNYLNVVSIVVAPKVLKGEVQKSHVVDSDNERDDHDEEEKEVYDIIVKGV